MNKKLKIYLDTSVVSYLLQDYIPDFKGYKPIEILNPSVLLESEE